MLVALVSGCFVDLLFAVDHVIRIGRVMGAGAQDVRHYMHSVVY